MNAVLRVSSGKKSIKILLLLFFFIFTGNLFSTEIVKIKSFDNTIITGKLDLPAGTNNVPYLVIFVPGTGPNTYDVHRNAKGKEFNYYDLFASEICRLNIGFFRYNTRGTYPGKNGPWYDSVNVSEYKNNTPIVHARDIESMIIELTKDNRLKGAKIILLGWSEGTIIASLVAERNAVPIDALVFGGYANDNFYDIMDWQLNGSNRLIILDQLTGKKVGEKITKEDFNNIPEDKKANPIINKQKFENLDLDKDGIITENDFKMGLEKYKELVFSAIKKGDDNWLWKNYFRITTDYVKRHMELPPNKVRLLNIDRPIYIFHGIYDANAPVTGAFDIYDRFNIAGKKNLFIKIYNEYEHNLGYEEYIKSGVISEGLKDMFLAIKGISTGERSKNSFDIEVKKNNVISLQNASTSRNALVNSMVSISALAKDYFKSNKTFIGFSLPSGRDKDEYGSYSINKCQENEISFSGEGIKSFSPNNSKTKISMKVYPEKIETTVTD